MKLIFSSFGIGSKRTTRLSPAIFDRMPPAVFSGSRQQFQPDFSALLLAEQIVVDDETLSKLEKHEWVLFSDYGKLLRRLDKEGYLQVEDYSGVLAGEQDLLDQQLENDLAQIDSYDEVAIASSHAWNETFKTFRKQIPKHLLDGDLDDLTERAHEVAHEMLVHEDRSNRIRAHEISKWRHIQAGAPRLEHFLYEKDYPSIERSTHMNPGTSRQNGDNPEHPKDKLLEQYLLPYFEYTNAKHHAF